MPEVPEQKETIESPSSGDSGAKGKKQQKKQSKQPCSTDRAGFVKSDAENSGVKCDQKADSVQTVASNPAPEKPVVKKVNRYREIFSGVGAKLRSSLGGGGSKCDSGVATAANDGVNAVGTTSVMKDRGNVPNPDASFPNDRSGRVTFATEFQLDNAPSEQSVNELITQPRICDRPEEGQGYPGIEKDNYRSRKIDGEPTQAFLDKRFHRSMDLITLDRMVHTSGQVQEIPALTNVYPSKTFNPATGVWDAIAPPARATRGNHVLRGAHIVFRNNAVKAITWLTDPVPVSVTDIDDSTIDDGAPEGDIDHQVIAKIDNYRLTQYGDITEPDKFVQLGNAIPEAALWDQLLMDCDLITGSLITAAIQAQDTAWSMQMSMVSKFGTNAICHRNHILNPVECDANGAYDMSLDAAYDPFADDASSYKAGSLSLLIAMFDSPAKYPTRSQLFMLPRSPKMFLGMADQFLDCFRIKPEFKKWLDYNTVCGLSVDEYNGVNPILLTRKIGLIIPFDPDLVMEWDETNQCFKAKYHYTYTTQYGFDMIVGVMPPVFAGFGNWVANHAQQFCRRLKFTQADTDYSYDVMFDFNHYKPDIGSAMLLAAISDIEMVRRSVMHDVDRATQKMGTYPFSALKTLKEFNPFQHRGYTTNNIDSVKKKVIIKPIDFKRVDDDQIMLFSDPEEYMVASVYETGADNHNIVGLIQPWYMSVDRLGTYNTFERATDGVWKNKNIMNWPVLRAVSVPKELGHIMEIGPNRYRKAKDIALAPYGRSRIADATYIRPYLAGAQGQLMLTWLTEADPAALEDDVGTTLPTVGEVLSTLREFGWSFPAPTGYMERGVSAGGLAMMNKALTDKAFSLVTMSVFSFFGAGVDPNVPATAFKQTYKRLYNYASDTIQSGFGDDTGIYMSLAAILKSADLAVAVTPAGAPLAAKRRYPFDFSKHYFQFALFNPFEIGYRSYATLTAPAGQLDPSMYGEYILDDAVAFGFAGFEASDYEQEKNCERTRRQTVDVAYVKNEVMYKNSPVL